MQNCDTFARVAAAESRSADFLWQMLRLCIPVSSKRTQTRQDSKEENSASRRSVAVIRAASSLKAGAIGRNTQYIC